mgnify:CR=1 FL=1
MNFLIVTHVVHTQKGNDYFAYSPYVNEMNIWLKYVDKVTIIAPLRKVEMDSIYQKYNHSNINFVTVPEFSFLNAKEIMKAIFVLPYILVKLFWVMIFADHIHLRCPGNMGLLGSFVQLFFPWKAKSAKYAGNWEASSKQPMSYRMQQKILSNTFLTHNIKVLVYGAWKNQTKNIKPFFTATYFKSELKEVAPKTLNVKIKFIFVGTLSKGKQPLYALQLVEMLHSAGFDVSLSFYGMGNEYSLLEAYVVAKGLTSFVYLKGNVDRDSLISIYQESHFLILPSKSEGWPKVVAEAMFWGCVPVVTPVSCVPDMLDFGARGILLTENKEEDLKLLEKVLLNEKVFNSMRNKGMIWSRNFTIDKFESEIQTIIRP